MSTIKTVVVVAVLAIIGYGLYQGLNNGFEFQNPPPFPAEVGSEQPNYFSPPAVILDGQQSNPSGQEPMPPVAVMPPPGAVPLTPPNPAMESGPGLAGISATPGPPPSAEAAAVPHDHDSLGDRYGNAGQTDLAAVGSAPLGGQMPAGIAAAPPPTDSPAAAGISGVPAPTDLPAAGLAGLRAPGVTGLPLPNGVVPPADLAETAATPPANALGDRYASLAPEYRQAPNAGSGPDATTASAPPAQPGQSEPAAGVADLPTNKNAAFAAAMSSAQEQLQRGQLGTALLTLSIWYEHPQLSPDEHKQLTSVLDQVAGTVIYSRKHLLEPPYRVKAGDSLDDIAGRYKVPPGLLAKINGIADPNSLQPNQELKVVRGPFNAKIDTKQGLLTLFLGGRYAGRFQVNAGPEFENIIGSYVVTAKNRAHSGHGGYPWIEIGHGYEAAKGDSPRLGLTGMATPAEAVSGAVPGRIGVSLQDSQDLFDILSQGSKITIRR